MKKTARMLQAVQQWKESGLKQKAILYSKISLPDFNRGTWSNAERVVDIMGTNPSKFKGDIIPVESGKLILNPQDFVF